MILKDSRYEQGELYLSRGVLFTGTRQPVSIKPDDGDRWVVFGPGDRVDNFAYRVWPEAGDAASRLWWVLCDVNDIVNPFTIPSGTLLRVPTLERIAIEVLL